MALEGKEGSREGPPAVPLAIVGHEGLTGRVQGVPVLVGRTEAQNKLPAPGQDWRHRTGEGHGNAMLASRVLSLKDLKVHLSSELSLRKASLPQVTHTSVWLAQEGLLGRGHLPGTWKKKEAEV